MKLVRAEHETPALRAHLLTVDDLVSSALTETEVLRAARREDVALVPLATAVLGDLSMLIEVDRSILRDAGSVPPPEVRSLDAIHLASARRLGPDLAGMITYDDRLADAASALGIAVVAPGR